MSPEVPAAEYSTSEIGPVRAGVTDIPRYRLISVRIRAEAPPKKDASCSGGPGPGRPHRPPAAPLDLAAEPGRAAPEQGPPRQRGPRRRDPPRRRVGAGRPHEVVARAVQVHREPDVRVVRRDPVDVPALRLGEFTWSGERPAGAARRRAGVAVEQAVLVVVPVDV